MQIIFLPIGLKISLNLAVQRKYLCQRPEGCILTVIESANINLRKCNIVHVKFRGRTLLKCHNQVKNF